MDFIITCLDVYCLNAPVWASGPDTILAENKINSSLKYLKATVLCFITMIINLYITIIIF